MSRLCCTLLLEALRDVESARCRLKISHHISQSDRQSVMCFNEFSQISQSVAKTAITLNEQIIFTKTVFLFNSFFNSVTLPKPYSMKMIHVSRKA